MTTLTYKIANLERNTEDGGVITAHWTLTGEDVQGETTYTGSVYGSVGLEYDAQDPDFVPFEALTEELVIGWVKEALGEETVAAHEANVQGQINDQKAPKTQSGLPWANA